MLEKPWCGWTNVSIGEIKMGSASYIEDVPMNCIEAFINYFSLKSKLGLAFHLTFDAEGYSFGIMQFNDELYYVDTSNIQLKLEHLSPNLLGLDEWCGSDKMLEALAREVISDIRKNFDDWVRWDMCGDETEEDVLNRRLLLEENCNKLETILKNKKC